MILCNLYTNCKHEETKPAPSEAFIKFCFLTANLKLNFQSEETKSLLIYTKKKGLLIPEYNKARQTLNQKYSLNKYIQLVILYSTNFIIDKNKTCE